VATDLVEETQVSFSAKDGYNLVGTLFETSEPSSSVCVFVPGVGIPARRYSRFLRAIAAAGLPVFAADPRGIGRSRQCGLRGLEVSIEDWAEWDYGAAIDWVKDRYPDRALVGISHSFGSMLLAATAEGRNIRRIAMIAPHTGYWGDYSPAWRLPMLFLWHAVMPAVTAVWGYFPGSKMRLGEDLPRGIAMQWAGRLRGTFRPAGSVADRSRSYDLLSNCDSVTGDVLLVQLAGDLFATPSGIARVSALMPRANKSIWSVGGGTPRLGHFGFFGAQAAQHWPGLLARLLQIGSEPTLSRAAMDEV